MVDRDQDRGAAHGVARHHHLHLKSQVGGHKPTSGRPSEAYLEVAGPVGLGGGEGEVELDAGGRPELELAALVQLDEADALQGELGRVHVLDANHHLRTGEFFFIKHCKYMHLVI